MKKRWLIISILLCSIVVVSALWIRLNKKPEVTQIVILHINDFHGKLEPDQMGQAGAAALATLIKRERIAAAPNVIFLAAGDFNTGQFIADINRGKPTIEALNLMRLDATSVGNHEFDNPFQVLRQQMKFAKFNFIAANIRMKNGSLPFKPYIIKKIAGLKIGIFGLTTSTTPQKQPLYSSDFIFDNELVVAAKMVKILREKEKVDIVIALTHMGVDKAADRIVMKKLVNSVNNRGTAMNLYLTRRYVGRVTSRVIVEQLAATVKGIDIIIDGHSHTNMKKPLYINGTPIVQAHCYGLRLGKAVLTFNKGKVSLSQWKSIPVNPRSNWTFTTNELPPDDEVATLIKKYTDEL